MEYSTPMRTLRRMMRWLPVWALLFLFFALACMVAYAAGLAAEIPSGGAVVVEGIEVWLDPAGTAPVESVDWDYPGPGENVTRTLYVQNVGNWPAAISLSTAKWVPAEAEAFLALVWDYTGTVVPPGAIVPVTLELRVSPDVVGIREFSFDIVIDIEAVIPPD